MTRLGIFGGTFDPVHIGHLLIAERAYEEAELDKVIFMPTDNPPHKNSSQITPFEYRKEMVELAIKDNPNFVFSDLETKRQGIIYTSDTLKILKDIYKDTELYFIMGEDSLDDFHKWHEPEKITQLANILVSVRSLNDDFEEKIKCMNKEYGNVFTMLKMPYVDISSSDIRARIKNGKTVKYMMTNEVCKYIDNNAIYGSVIE